MFRQYIDMNIAFLHQATMQPHLPKINISKRNHNTFSIIVTTVTLDCNSEDVCGLFWWCQTSAESLLLWRDNVKLCKSQEANLDCSLSIDYYIVSDNYVNGNSLVISGNPIPFKSIWSCTLFISIDLLYINQ